MKKITPKTLLFVSLLIVAAMLSACNNPAAANPASFWPWTWGDRTVSQTQADAAEKCSAFGLGVVAIDPSTGDPTCGTTTSAVPASANNGNQRAVGPQGSEDRASHMLRLNEIKDIPAWLEAAGLPYNWSAGYFDARQPEEETLSLADGSTRIVKSGMQVDVRGLYVQWPACLTTDKPSRVITQNTTRSYQPDPTNGSKQYTNATTSGDGKVTVWVDCSNWSQLADPLK